MEVQVNFKIINPDFNKKYANEYHSGEESESNWKYLSAASYKVTGVKSVSNIDSESFRLKVKFTEYGVPVFFDIPRVSIFRCNFENGTYEDFAVSKSILNKTHQAKKVGYDVMRFYFYINSQPPCLALGSNLIIDESDIPEEMFESKKLDD